MTHSETLALLGGAPVCDHPMQFNNSIGAAEKAAVQRVLDSGELSGFVATAGEGFWGGREVRALETDFKTYFGVTHALAFNSATSALHAAVSAMGVGPGDEVITSPYTMSATATAILMTGAVPIFADIEDQTFGLDPESVEANITNQTRGILAVNLLGHPARLGPLRAIADRHDLFLIEDNAQAPDAEYHGKKTGTIGDIGVFSFNRHKAMQSGEGGMLVTNDEKRATKAALMRNHGEVVVADMGIDDIVNTVGLNYRMGEMEAAIAQVQFSRMQELNGDRMKLAARLSRNLEDVPGITPPAIDAECSHVFYIYGMKYNAEETGIPREIFVEAMAAEGFGVRGGYVRPIYLEPLYRRQICFGSDGFPFSANPRNNLRYEPGLCPTCEQLQDREFMITGMMQPPQTESDMDLFAEACRKVIDNRDALANYVTKG